MYNLTNATNGGAFINVMGVSNDVTNGLFWLIMTLVLWIVLTIAIQRNSGILPAIAVSSYITSIAGILLVITGLVGEGYLVYYILTIALAVAATFVAGKGEE